MLLAVLATLLPLLPQHIALAAATLLLLLLLVCGVARRALQRARAAPDSRDQACCRLAGGGVVGG
jgi:predicted MFS family arabinose efflux permease